MAVDSNEKLLEIGHNFWKQSVSKNGFDRKCNTFCDQCNLGFIVKRFDQDPLTW